MKEARYVIVLTGISLVCATLLGAVYQVTEEPIRQAKNKAVVEGIQKVLPEGTKADADNKVIVDESNPLSPVIYPAVRDGVVVGAAVKATSTAGYGGNLVVMVGIEGVPGSGLKVFNTSVLDMSKETPGLGTKVAEPAFAGQWNNRLVTEKAMAVKKDGGDVVAVSGATITSRAFTDCVNQAINAWTKLGPAIVKGGSNG